MADRSVPTTQVAGPSPEAGRSSLASQPPSFWRRTFAALQRPNYRLWFLGQLVSLVGTWMQITAQSFLVTPGHNVEVWLEPKYQVLIANALRWCGGNQAT